MNRMIIKSALVLFIALIISPPFSAWATDVDYDAVDEAALFMTAQTDILQASDQFMRAYHQLLVYDHEEFSGDYNYQNCLDSLTAGSVVLFVDGDGEDYGFWAGSLVGYSQLNLGYDVGTTKLAALAEDNQPLSGTLDRIGAAYTSGWNGFVWCMDVGVQAAVAAASGIVAGIGVFLGGTAAAACAKAAVLLWAGYCVICILVGCGHWWKTIFFGSVLIAVPSPFRRRRLVKQLKVEGF